MSSGPGAPNPYFGLKPTRPDSFPRGCPKCGRAFGSLEDFIAATRPVGQASGLIETIASKAGSGLFLMRNCLCGTTAGLFCQDRRDQSSRGRSKRVTLGKLLQMLQEGGLSPEDARREVGLDPLPPQPQTS
jgi:hypothetical protein